MIDLFFITIIILTLVLFGGLLYLLYLPFKSRLLKTGKLTVKNSKRINYIYLTSLLLIGIIFYSFKDYRTPSKDRFEKTTNIKLPESIKVTEDRFESAGPDYGLVYKFVLTERDCSELGSKIKESNEWIKQDEFWTFYKTVDGVIYNITFDKQKCRVIYNEDLI